mmetsp:Transcript_23617/g.36434  ORF Transcript_23617/g.36434 Transcript_23617/m.36434 type:complete len:339 (-) Transcript_23617:77-1093(-)|eukprot:CAMPEP_0196824244 /NCGR_PEP_ID=MMETSP1362-20130617/91025_1 /TAXON_ID=163516 /ORGANISM="Leptocylindrus danicus, Strain CCMP1856" /LENGTH=338 /DNA_ID=CAMNT_0042204431 /DNA_START=247 /DNA_END=1263 /DNA_ORIENTATION=+
MGQKISKPDAILLQPSMEGDLDKVKDIVGSQITPSMTAQSIVNATDAAGNSAIHGAVFSGHMHVVKFLVEACSADTSQKNDLGCSPLWLAAGYGHEDILQYLVQIIFTDPDEDKQRELLNSPNSTGDTPLIAAASRGHANIIQLLLVAASSRFNEKESFAMQMLMHKNKGGDSALSVAVGAGNESALKVLIEWDYKNKEEDKVINCKNQKGLTPLLIACERGDSNLAFVLIENGALPLCDANGSSPLSVAAFCGCEDVVRQLLQLSMGKELLNSPDTKGRGCTPLWLASRTGNHKIVNILLEAGADPNIPNDDGITPMGAAEKYKKQEVIDALTNFKQ